ncbi:hypothetical protein MTR_3g091720 [Medicago truncatula]|uniref:Uncharacterized protein n=1 Tax=Medicago truncatula TaxID=3880 RepID=G7J7G2_MEDTR|nr:hypothetical protein MTR_3g091720 [Medicago truncatula]
MKELWPSLFVYDSEEQSAELGLVKEVAMLEKLPEMELNEEIKKLRQACFRAKYSKRRLITLNP